MRSQMLLRLLIQLLQPRTRSIGIINKLQCRKVSILSRIESSPVLVSANKDVCTNLAIEHLLYSKLRFKEQKKEGNVIQSEHKVFKTPVVFIWTDEPCLVIGRHQNPWIEANLGYLSKAGIKLARRHSGGGCVYHDENNINISVIGDRSDFENRQKNLKFLAQVLGEKYGIKCEPTKRHDLVHCETGHKISGSAAKLGQYNSYHHFTLLVDSDKDKLYNSIRQEQQNFIQTNSSLSTRSKVVNLQELKPNLEVNQIITDIAGAYNKLLMNPKAKQPALKDSPVQGDDVELESLNKFKAELESWDWIYGRTPKFKLDRSFKLMVANVEKQIRFGIQVNKGLFENIRIDCDLENAGTYERYESLIGSRFTYVDAVVNIAKLLQIDEAKMLSPEEVTHQLIGTFLLQLIQDSNY